VADDEAPPAPRNAETAGSLIDDVREDPSVKLATRVLGGEVVAVRREGGDS
jgi:hypothetical protein